LQGDEPRVHQHSRQGVQTDKTRKKKENTVKITKKALKEKLKGNKKEWREARIEKDRLELEEILGRKIETNTETSNTEPLLEIEDEIETPGKDHTEVNKMIEMFSQGFEMRYIADETGYEDHQIKRRLIQTMGKEKYDEILKKFSLTQRRKITGRIETEEVREQLRMLKLKGLLNSRIPVNDKDIERYQLTEDRCIEINKILENNTLTETSELTGVPAHIILKIK
jgi:hypothetical protein